MSPPEFGGARRCPCSRRRRGTSSTEGGRPSWGIRGLRGGEPGKLGPGVAASQQGEGATGKFDERRSGRSHERMARGGGREANGTSRKCLDASPEGVGAAHAAGRWIPRQGGWLLGSCGRGGSVAEATVQEGRQGQ